MSVSLMWGLLFATDSLQIWHCKVLLVIHGISGVFWNTSAQVLLYDIVGPERLQSAVRSNASSRYLGTLMGPAVGSALMLVMTPAHAMFINMLIYLPLLLWLWKAPYGPKFRAAPPLQRALRGFADVFATLRAVASNHALFSMILLSGCASLFIGTAYQAQMPGFAKMLGHGDPGVAYGVLLAADAAGALLAGILLESRGYCIFARWPVVCVAGGLCIERQLPTRDCLAIRCWISRTLIRVHVANAGATQCA
jgi:Transmembrane secretion effector